MRVIVCSCEFPTVDAAQHALRVFQPLLRSTLWDEHRREMIVRVEDDLTDTQIDAIGLALQGAGCGPAKVAP